MHYLCELWPITKLQNVYPNDTAINKRSNLFIPAAGIDGWRSTKRTDMTVFYRKQIAVGDGLWWWMQGEQMICLLKICLQLKPQRLFCRHWLYHTDTRMTIWWTKFSGNMQETHASTRAQTPCGKPNRVMASLNSVLIMFEKVAWKWIFPRQNGLAF